MKKQILLTTLISGALLGLSACGGGSSGGDTTAPVITVTGGDVSIIEGTAFTDAGATAVDDVDGTLVPLASGAVDVNTPGVYTITYTATDAAGNIGTATRTVTVAEDGAPVITVNGGNVSITEGTAYTDAGASAVDDIDGAVVPVTTGTVDTNTPGVYTITYTAIDSSGNTSTATRTVTVIAFGTAFNGTWESLTCISGTNTSFKQTNVVIDGSNVTSTIDAWTQVNCPPSVTAIPLTLVADFQYSDETPVAAGCDGTTATEVDVTLESITALGITRTGDAAIRALLATVAPDVGNTLAAFNLLCLGNNQLLSGDVSGANNGTTEALRPDSMDTVNVFIPKP